MLVGVGMAAGLTWYLMKSPKPFLPQEPVADKAADAAKSQPPATTPSGAANGKPRFEFYNVLTDKPDGKTTAPAKPAEKPKTVEKAKPADSKPTAAFTPQILQVGSFTSAEDAEKLKARLAFIGAEAQVQTASVPDKGVRYRVRLGPYKNEEEMNRARSFLKQNNIDSVPMRAQ